MIKRRVVLYLIVIALLATFIVCIRAANPAFVIDRVEGKKGEQVNVNISLKNNPGIASAKLVVTFDDGLTLDSVKYGNLGGMTMNPQRYTSPVILNWFNALKNLEGDVVYATLTFSIPKKANKSFYSISLKYNQSDVFNVKEQDIYFDIQNGGIRVTDVETTSTTQTETTSTTYTEITSVTQTTQIIQTTQQTSTTQTEARVTTEVIQTEVTSIDETSVKETTNDVNTTYVYDTTSVLEETTELETQESVDVTSVIETQEIITTEEITIESQTESTSNQTKEETSSYIETTNEKNNSNVALYIIIPVAVLACTGIVVFILIKKKK